MCYVFRQHQSLQSPKVEWKELACGKTCEDFSININAEHKVDRPTLGKALRNADGVSVIAGCIDLLTRNCFLSRDSSNFWPGEAATALETPFHHSDHI